MLVPPFGLHLGILEKAGLLGGQLTECLQFQDQQAEDRIHFPHSGRPRWNVMGGRQFGMPTDHPAGCPGACGGARRWRCVYVTFNASGFLCVNGGGGFPL